MTERRTPEQPFWAHCKVCGWAWVAAYVPMAIGLFARVVKGQVCPKCGGQALCGKSCG
jgi:hypothetical protein